MNEEVYVQSTNRTVASSLLWMFFGLLSTAIIAVVAYSSGIVLEVVESWTIIAIAELAVAWIFGLCFRKLSTGVATILFFVYSMLTGLTFSVIFAIFEIETIYYALFATSALFGVLAYMGYNTKRDITKLGTILYATLFVGLIISVVNLFIGNGLVDIFLDWVILFIFSGLTCYDMNVLKGLSETGEDQEKVAIYGAMQLYLDFINMFLRILSIMSKRRN